MWSKWSWLLVFTTFLLATAPCFADVVPISVSEQVNGSLNAGIQISVTVGCVVSSNSFSFADSNNQAGPFSTNKLGDASASWTEFYLDASGQARQTSDITTDNFNVQLSTQSRIGGFNEFGGAFSSVNNEVALEFDLTSLSILHLTGVTVRCRDHLIPIRPDRFYSILPALELISRPARTRQPFFGAR